VPVQFRGVRTRVGPEPTIGRRVDRPEASPAALIRGYGKALGEILSELAADFGRAG
jgi:hypothetical protein